MRKFIFVLSLIFIAFLSSCSKPTPTLAVDEPGGTCSIDPQSTCAAPTSAAEQPALYGTWVREGDALNTLAIDAKSVELVEKAADGTTHNSKYDIVSVDWAKYIVTMQLTSLTTDGKTAEIPAGLTYMKVWIDNDTFFYALGTEAAGAPSEATIGPFTRK